MNSVNEVVKNRQNSIEHVTQVPRNKVKVSSRTSNGERIVKTSSVNLPIILLKPLNMAIPPEV